MDSILIYINVDQKDITFYLPSYVQYSTIAARAVRQALKGDAKEAASKRGKLYIYSSGDPRFIIWDMSQPAYAPLPLVNPQKLTHSHVKV